MDKLYTPLLSSETCMWRCNQKPYATGCNKLFHSPRALPSHRPPFELPDLRVLRTVRSTPLHARAPQTVVRLSSRELDDIKYYSYTPSGRNGNVYIGTDIIFSILLVECAATHNVFTILDNLASSWAMTTGLRSHYHLRKPSILFSSPGMD